MPTDERALRLMPLLRLDLDSVFVRESYSGTCGSSRISTSGENNVASDG